VSTGTTPRRTPVKASEERALADVLARLEAQLDDLVERATEEIFAENPAYRERVDARLREDVSEHVREHFTSVIVSFRERRETTREDLLFIRRHASRRIGQLSVADFIQAFHVGQRVLWQATLALADDEPSRRAVLGLVSYIASYFEVATTHAAEVYLDAEKLLGEDAERLRRDALEELLAGAAPQPGPRMHALRDAGLEPNADLLVISALPLAGTDDAHGLRGAASSLARVANRSVPPLAVIRRAEIVVVTPARESSATSMVARLQAVQRRLDERGLALAVGMSTIHSGLGSVPAAYREASGARELLGPEGGVAALPAMSAFEYMVRHSGPIARRLVPPEVERFVTADAASGGALIATLRAFAAADMNVARAARDLHIHVNTAHYRLARISERTGADLRRLKDLIGLLIAAEVANAEAAPGAAARSGPAAATALT
jgi:hypothetical protein